MGIAKPWADCLILRKRLEHTVLNGKRLKFEGTGMELFIERLKWIFFTIITFTLYGFTVPVRRKGWILAHIHFEEEELSNSYYDGKISEFIILNLILNTMNILSLGILYPFTKCVKLKHLANHSIINNQKIVFNGRAYDLLLHYILHFILIIITLGIYIFWLGISHTKWEVKNSHIEVKGLYENKKISILNIPFIIIIIIFGIYIISKTIIPFLNKTIDNKYLFWKNPSIIIQNIKFDF